MSKSCLSLIATLLVVASSSLLADDEPPAYFHFKDCPAPHGSTSVAPGTPTYFNPTYFTYKDYPTPPQAPPPDAGERPHNPPNPMPSCPPKSSAVPSTLSNR